MGQGLGLGLGLGGRLEMYEALRSYVMAARFLSMNQWGNEIDVL